jgi:hypothetical protein
MKEKYNIIMEIVLIILGIIGWIMRPVIFGDSVAIWLMLILIAILFLIFSIDHIKEQKLNKKSKKR